jgi:hypothetical protein
MREFIVLVITIIVGVLFYSFWQAHRDVAADPDTAGATTPPPETLLPFQAVLAVGADDSIVVGGRRYHFGVSLVSDSRCPKGANCVTAGEGLVVAWVRSVGGTPEDVRLSTVDEVGKPLGPVTARVLDLSPYPVMGETISRDTYRITLQLSKT